MRRIWMTVGLVLLLAACDSTKDDTAAATPAPESLANAEAHEPEAGAPGSPENKLPSEVNPNGDSELAVVMREMHGDAKVVRGSIIDAKPLPPLPEGQARMLSAWPTDPDVRGPEFDALARDYLGVLEDLHAEGADPHASFDQLVDACVGCHQSFCPGPISAIEKLRITDTL